MKAETTTHSPAGDAKISWLRYALIILVCEKIIQHIFVTAAFYFDWGAIASTVAVNPSILMILGAVAAMLFILSLWGLLTRRNWATLLVIGLALFDMIGEFAAQGTIMIVINVSFIVATLLLILALLWRRQEMKNAA